MNRALSALNGRGFRRHPASLPPLPLWLLPLLLKKNQRETLCPTSLSGNATRRMDGRDVTTVSIFGVNERKGSRQLFLAPLGRKHELIF